MNIRFEKKARYQWITNLFSDVFGLLLPGPLQCYWYQCTSGEPTKTPDTGYLDGLRGLVAFLVYVRHFTLPWISELDYGYLHEGHDGLLRLPIFRLLYAGPNVPVMLVISGFVLSLKPLKMIELAMWDKLFPTVSSAIFRRAPRLFVPPIVSTGLVMLAVVGGRFNYPYATLPGKAPPHPQNLGFPDQIFDWLHYVVYDMTNPWKGNSPAFLYGAHLWTISMQFRCSLLLTLLQLGFARVKPAIRIYLTSALTLYVLMMGQWDFACYSYGYMIAQFYTFTSKTNRQQISGQILTTPTSSTPSRIFSNILPYMKRIPIYFFGLYFASFPRQRSFHSAPGYKWCTAISYNYHIWHACSGMLIVHSFHLCKTAQSIFSTNVARYFGKISFSLYIIHEPLLHILGYRTVELASRFTGYSTPLQTQTALLLGFLMTTPLVLWVADVFSRVIEQPCAHLSIGIDRLMNEAP